MGLLKQTTKFLAIAWLCLAVFVGSTCATDLIKLTPENWDDLIPAGKEVDAIYGDYVFRNDKIVVVIAQPTRGRDANLTIRDIGGCILDMTTVDKPNDQLGVYVPLAGQFKFRSTEGSGVLIGSKKLTGDWDKTKGNKIMLSFKSTSGPDGQTAFLLYTLSDGDQWLTVDHLIQDKDGKTIGSATYSDMIRADRTFKFGVDQSNKLFWANDDWFQQCYGVLYPQGEISRSKKRGVQIEFKGKSRARMVGPGSSLLDIKGKAMAHAGTEVSPVSITVSDPLGRVSNAQVTVYKNGKKTGTARTGPSGETKFSLPDGKYEVAVSSLAHPELKWPFGVSSEETTEVEVSLDEQPPVVDVAITDVEGNPIPCKVAFYGSGETPNPDFGPDSTANPVRNLYYSHTGSFSQVIPAGSYDVIVSRGPEYDAERFSVEAKVGERAKVVGTLKRVVDTSGWVSTEYHSHSSESGDNTSDQRGRVLNLLCEHIEFAPCTEHQRIDSYAEHIVALNAEKWIASCSGMELTGSPLPLNHQNSFPLVHKPRTQNGGGPRVNADPELQIERLAYWDSKSEKLVQVNHPNLVQMTGDANLDGKVDKGYRKMLDFMDVVEVHPPHWIFDSPEVNREQARRGNVIVNWMQLLNQGYRITGVVNTDAHYNFHGSGGLRNYVMSSNDDPSEIDTMEMVRASKRGAVVMTTGPFMEVFLVANGGPAGAFMPGATTSAKNGKVSLTVKIQCPNWLDVNRVQVFGNGRPIPELNFTRRDGSEGFGNGVVKFKKSMKLTLKEDTHLIVATIGEGLKLGRVMGPQVGQNPPCAVSNPIFVDVDGNGFQANGDRLGFPFLIQK